jgi:hypothetical protein
VGFLLATKQVPERSSKVDVVSDLIPDDAAEIPHTPYADEILTHVGQDHVDRLTRVFEDMGVAQWLKEHPLTRLELTHKVLDLQDVEVNGMYSFKFQTVQVATMRSTDEYHKVFDWQRVHSVSSTGDSPTETVRRTLVHELGHHVHNILRHTDLETFEKTLIVNFLAGGTLYAQSSAYEYFAESFALYVFFRQDLRDRDPRGYAMMEMALFRVGLEVNPI